MGSGPRNACRHATNTGSTPVGTIKFQAGRTVPQAGLYPVAPDWSLDPGAAPGAWTMGRKGRVGSPLGRYPSEGESPLWFESAPSRQFGGDALGHGWSRKPSLPGSNPGASAKLKGQDVRWKTLTGTPVPDILEFVKEAARNGQAVHIGTDSLQSKRFSLFTSVVVVLTPGKGGRVAYCKRVVPRISSLRERLLRETALSVDLGLTLNEVVKGELTIHLDVNDDARYRSSAHVQELVGYVVGQGFKALIKPNAWASSHVADWSVRHLTGSGNLAGDSEAA